MQRFRIKRVEPPDCRETIMGLWARNLPQTPPERFDWMNNNPEGPVLWYLAFDEANGTIAGSISIMPRKLAISGKPYLAGIVGDFMVEKKYRAFGPAMTLMKTVVREYRDLGFDFLYTIPNRASEKLILAAGFQKLGLLRNFMKLLHVRNKLEKHLPPILAGAVSPWIDLGLKLVSKETYVRSGLSFQELTEMNSECETFLREACNRWVTMGERSTPYFTWKYFRNPEFKLRVFAFHSAQSSSILGYVVFNVTMSNVYVFDILANGEDDFKKILLTFVRYLRKSHYTSVSIRSFDDNPLVSCIRSSGFFCRKGDDFPLHCAGDPKLLPKQWVFFNGDRNA